MADSAVIGKRRLLFVNSCEFESQLIIAME
jgi:hypothetical protein